MPFCLINPSMTNHVNSRIVDGKIMFNMCMLTFITFTFEFSVLEFSVWSSVHSNSPKSVYCCLLITLWKCEYGFIWLLGKSILFGTNSLKVSVLCDGNSEKVCSIFGSNSLKLSILFDMKSEKVCTIVASNSLKVWILFYFFSQMFYYRIL